MICVSIARTRHRMMIAEHQALAQRGAKLVELRIDWLSRDPDVPRLLKDRPTPVIVTCRRAQDGGKWRGSEEERVRLLRTAIVSGVEFVDLEDDIAKSIPRYGKTKRIVSHHDYDGTPEHVEEIWAEMAEMNPDIIKRLRPRAQPREECQTADRGVLHGGIWRLEPRRLRATGITLLLCRLQSRP